jgi:hypothetical protein
MKCSMAINPELGPENYTECTVEATQFYDTPFGRMYLCDEHMNREWPSGTVLKEATPPTQETQ